jgi:hypothetical protein
MIVKPVHWNQLFLTEVKVYDQSDWKGSSPPSKKDFDTVHSIQAGESLHDALGRVPLCPNQNHPNPWIEIVLTAICSVIQPHDRLLEKNALLFYLHKYGMNQLLEIHGADVAAVRTEIENMQSRSD